MMVYVCVHRQSEGAKEDPVMPPGLQFDFETQGMARLQLKQLILQEVSLW
jgi:hypothetical protein